MYRDLPQVPLSGYDPHKQIGLCPAWEFLQDTLFLNDLDQRQVNLIVPGNHGLFEGHFSIALDAKIPAMHVDLLEKSGKLTWDTGCNLCLGAELRQVRALEERGPFLLHEHIIQPGSLFECLDQFSHR